MESLPLFLSFFAIIVQLNGVLGENDFIGKEIDKIHRFRRSHEYDKVLNTTNSKEQSKIDIEKSKTDVFNKKREQISTKRKPKVGKDEKQEVDRKIINIKQGKKNVSPRNLQHFIEDTDEELPVPVQHIKINEHRLKRKHFEPPFKNQTSNDTKPLQNEKIEHIPKKLRTENVTKESSHKLIPQLTADPENNKKSTNKSSSDINGQSIAKSVNTRKETKEKSIVSIREPPKDELDSKKQGSEDDIIEIKERKYEEEIVRCYPTKSCQPNIKRHWDASQNFNPQFSSSPYIQARNPNQGHTQTDPYQSVTYNKDKYLLPYTCANLKDQNNGNYFYVNFDVEPYNQAKEELRYQGYGSFDRVRKTWLDRDTKIRTTSKPDEYVETNVKGYVISNE